MKTLGIILAIIGIAMLILGGGFSFTKKEKVVRRINFKAKLGFLNKH